VARAEAVVMPDWGPTDTGGGILLEYAAVLKWHGSLRERTPPGDVLWAHSRDDHQKSV
jgi:hypothetical protein